MLLHCAQKSDHMEIPTPVQRSKAEEPNIYNNERTLDHVNHDCDDWLLVIVTLG